MYDYKAKVIRVVDGDTAEVVIDLGFNVTIRETVRFARIDAYETRLGKKTTPEMKKIGLEAKQYVIDTIEGKEIYLKTYKDSGKYGRYIADIFLDFEMTQNLNDDLVIKKYAVYKDY